MFDFLNNLTVVAPPEKEVTRSGPKKEWNPPTDVADLRVWIKTGKVYPSEGLVERFDLNYRNMLADDKGHGFDIIDSNDFKNYIPVPEGQRLLFISKAPRKDGKIDLFGSTTYAKESDVTEAAAEGVTMEKGDPMSDVMTQGAARKELLDQILEVYKLTPDEKQEYIDLKLVGVKDQPLRLPEGRKICMVPKKFTTGENKGQMTVQRRENPEFWILMPASLITA